MKSQYRTHFCAFLILMLIVSGSWVSVSGEDFYRKEPQRKYEGSVSFFFVHGYATAFYQDFENGFSTNEMNGTPLTGDAPGLIGAPGNVTMANVGGQDGNGGKGSFHHDVGLIIGADINSQLKLMTEQHWINRNNPRSDNFNSSFNELATTQAKIRWTPSTDLPLRVTFGRFWSSFGGYINDELLSAQNRFAPVPMARFASPYAFNDGIQFDGSHSIGENGLNWTLELNNGNNSFNGASGGTFDNNNASDVTGRVGFVPSGLTPKAHEAEIGLSYADGSLRSNSRNFPSSPTVSDSVPTDFNAEWSGQALDFRYIMPETELKAYYVRSNEEIAGGPDLERQGYLAEATQQLFEASVIGAVDGKVRYDYFEREAVANDDGSTANLNDAQKYEDTRLGFGLECHPQEQLKMSLEYHTSEEDGAYTNQVDDDGVVFETTASF